MIKIDGPYKQLASIKWYNIFPSLIKIKSPNNTDICIIIKKQILINISRLNFLFFFFKIFTIEINIQIYNNPFIIGA